MEALSLLLPQSQLYQVLSSLPPPDLTNPTGTTTMTIQMAIQDSLPVIEEIVSLAEKDEEEMIKKEVDKRRMRLGASGPEQLRREVGREVRGVSKVGYYLLNGLDRVVDCIHSSPTFTMRFSIIQIPRTTFVALPSRSCSAINYPTCTRCRY